MDVLKSLVQPLVGNGSNNSAIDGFKLVVLGGAVETARRASSSAWNHFVNSFFLTAHFSEDDFPYDWLMLWLSRRPEWQRSREVETTTRSGGPGGSSSSSSRGGSSGSSSPWGTPTGGGSNTGGATHPSAHSAHYNEEDRDWDMWEAALYAETNSAAGAAHWGESGNDNGEDGVRPRTRVVFQPTYDTTHTIFYRGHWLRVRRGRKDNGSEMLSISVVARNNAILKQLVLQAKKEYEAEAVHRIQIYFADAHGSWRWTDSRHKRPLSSIVLNPGVKEMLVDDARDFLRSEKWYADRGIPFRRGYLLHGVPGSGKSSLIHALAGQLQLDIYVVSLSASWISDNTLTSLMGRVPARCVLLLEDLDAAFVRSTNREDDGEGGGDGGDGGGRGGGGGGYGSGGGGGGYGGNSGGFGNNGGLGMDAFPSFSGLGGRPRRRFGRPDGLSDMNTLSLSGLLNALDGVAASEGRLLFATTNHLERLDPALSRPGRMDVWVEFKNASRWQAEALFRNFFPCEDVDDEAAAAELRQLNLNIDDKVQAREFRPSAEAVEKAMSEASSGSLGSVSGSESVSMPVSRSASVSISVSGASTPRTPRTPQTHAIQIQIPSETSLMPDNVPPPPSTLWSLSTSIASSATSLLSLSGSVLGSTPSVSSSGVSTASSPTAVSSASGSSRAQSQPQPPPAPAQIQTQVQTEAKIAVGAAKDQFGSDNTAYLPPPPDASLAKPKPLDKKTLAALAKQFADGVPEEEFSVAGLQGYLLKHKAQPEAAASGVEAWVKSELEMRERLQREKEAREEREKEQREKRRKENAEKQKAQRETEKKEKELERVKALLAEKDKEDELEKMRQQLKEKEAAAKKKKEKKERKEKEKSEGKKEKEKKSKEKSKKEKKKDKKAQEPKSEDENDEESKPTDKKETDKDAVETDNEKKEKTTTPSDTTSSTDTDADTKATDAPVLTPVVVSSDSSSSDSSSSDSSDSDSSDSEVENRAPPAPVPSTSTTARKRPARRHRPALTSNSATPPASTSWSSAPRPGSSAVPYNAIPVQSLNPYGALVPAPVPLSPTINWTSWTPDNGAGSSGAWSPTSGSPPPGW